MAIRSELGSPGLGCPNFAFEVGLFLLVVFLLACFSSPTGFDLVTLATTDFLVDRFLFANGETSTFTLSLTLFWTVGFSVGFFLASFFLAADSVDGSAETKSIPNMELRSSSAMTAFGFFDLLALVKESLS